MRRTSSPVMMGTPLAARREGEEADEGEEAQEGGEEPVASDDEEGQKGVRETEAPVSAKNFSPDLWSVRKTNGPGWTA